MIKYLGLLLILSIIVFSVILVIQKTSENFTDTSECPNYKTCQDGWQPYSNAGGRLQISFPFGYEKVGDKCYCRPGLLFNKNSDDDGCYCKNDKGVGAPSSYYVTTDSQGDGIYGLNTAKIGDECIADTDCGQIKVNSNTTVDYLSNLRCDVPYNIYKPYLTPKGKCQDISTLYKNN